jgi:hypothetical protein
MIHGRKQILPLRPEVKLTYARTGGRRKSSATEPVLFSQSHTTCHHHILIHIFLFLFFTIHYHFILFPWSPCRVRIWLVNQNGGVGDILVYLERCRRRCLVGRQVGVGWKKKKLCYLTSSIFSVTYYFLFRTHLFFLIYLSSSYFLEYIFCSAT